MERKIKELNVLDFVKRAFPVHFLCWQPLWALLELGTPPSVVADRLNISRARVSQWISGNDLVPEVHKPGLYQLLKEAVELSGRVLENIKLDPHGFNTLSCGEDELLELEKLGVSDELNKRFSRDFYGALNRWKDRVGCARRVLELWEHEYDKQ